MQGLLFSFLTISVACAFIHPKMQLDNAITEHEDGQTIATRFDVPSGFTRLNSGEMASYFQSLPLYEQGREVHLYNGLPKANQHAHAAVIRCDIGQRDLQQCADACIRLRAEFLWQQQRFDEIHFELTNGWRMDYSEWRKGKKLIVKGHSTTWGAEGKSDTTYSGLRSYLDNVFMYAGTLSLHRELTPVDPDNMAIGDVIVQRGSPGHAVIIVDMAIDRSGQKLIMLAQSYMPAQEIHILRNPMDQSVWHKLENTGSFATAEWTFENFKIGRF